MKSTLIMALIGAASAKWGFGSCPKVESMKTLDMERYAGHWYEIYRDEHSWYTHCADCVTKEFELNQNGNLDLYFRGFYNWHGWGKYSGIGGEVSECGTSAGLFESSTCKAAQISFHSTCLPQTTTITILVTSVKISMDSFMLTTWPSLPEPQRCLRRSKRRSEP